MTAGQADLFGHDAALAPEVGGFDYWPDVLSIVEQDLVERLKGLAFKTVVAQRRAVSTGRDSTRPLARTAFWQGVD